MNWRDVAGKIKDAAPLLGSVLGMTGPAGAMAAKVVSAALGTPEDDPDQALREIEQNPEALVKLKTAQLDNAADLARIEVQDRQGARDRAIAFLQSTGHRDYLQGTLALLGVLGLGYAFYLLFHFPVQATSRDIILVLVGVVSKIVGDVYAYYFGSSRVKSGPT